MAKTAKVKPLLSKVSDTNGVVSQTLETPLTYATVPHTMAVAKLWHGQGFLFLRPCGPSISQGGFSEHFAWSRGPLIPTSRELCGVLSDQWRGDALLATFELELLHQLC